jgi:hypothetical protein
LKVKKFSKEIDNQGKKVRSKGPFVKPFKIEGVNLIYVTAEGKPFHGGPGQMI